MHAFRSVLPILVAALVLFSADCRAAKAQKVTAQGGDFWSQTEFETKSGTFVLMRCIGGYVTSAQEAEQLRRRSAREGPGSTTHRDAIRTPKGRWIKGYGDYKTDISGYLVNVADHGDKVFLVTSAAVYEYSTDPREELKKAYDVPRDEYEGAYHISGTDGTYYATFSPKNVFLGFVDYNPQADVWRLIPYTGYLVKKESVRKWNRDEAKKALIVQVTAFQDLQTVKLDPSEDIVEISFSLEEERFSGNGVQCLRTEQGDFYPKYKPMVSAPQGRGPFQGIYRFEREQPWAFFRMDGAQAGWIESWEMKESRLHLDFGKKVHRSEERLILDLAKGQFLRPWQLR